MRMVLALIQPTKLDLQLKYVRERTFWQDLKIIVYTVRRVVDPHFCPHELAAVPALRPGMGAAVA